MKPSNLFHDDNSPSKYWNSSSINRWNRECITGAKSTMGTALLIKLVILSILLVGFGYLFISWIYPYSSPTTQHTIDQASIVNFNKNLSITNSSMTEESTQITRLQKAAFQTSTQPSTNVIPHVDEHVEKSSDDDVLLTKKYVRLFPFKLIFVRLFFTWTLTSHPLNPDSLLQIERINFYTTSNKNIFSVKVSPTLPTIHKFDPTSELPIQSYANDNSCQSTSLPLVIFESSETFPSVDFNKTVENFNFSVKECSRTI